MSKSTCFFLVVLSFFYAFTSDLYSGELKVKTEYPEDSKFIAGKDVYPENVFNMSMKKGWNVLGSCGGHSLRALPVELQNRKGIELSAAISKAKSAPDWVSWRYTLDPELNIAGADYMHFLIYTEDKFDFPIYARMGSRKGFGLLPCSWENISPQLKPGKWTDVKVKIHETRQSIDLLNFDFWAKGSKVPEGKKFSFIIADFRLNPLPKPICEFQTGAFEVKSPVYAGFWVQRGLNEFSESDTLRIAGDLAVKSDMEDASVEIVSKNKKYMAPIKLRKPYTSFDLSLNGMCADLGAGPQVLTLRFLAGHKVIAEGSLQISNWPEADMERKREKLIKRLNRIQINLKRMKRKGIDVKLPEVSATTAELFLKHFIPDDFYRQKVYRIAHNELMKIDNILSETENELLSYQKGFKELPLLEYNPELPLDNVNGQFCQDGNPMLFIGPLGWRAGTDLCSYSKRLGFNTIVVETHIWGWMNYKPDISGKIKINTGFLRNKVEVRAVSGTVERYLEDARRNGLAANLLLAPHYKSDLYPDLPGARSPHCGNGNFNFDVLSPDTPKTFERIYGTMAPVLNKYPNLISLGVINEPDYSVSPRAVDFEKAFQNHIKGKYKTIEKTNKRWSSDYSSFEAIKLESVLKLAKSNSGINTDWQMFLNKSVNKLLSKFKKILNREVSGKFVWNKLISDFGFRHLDEELNIEICQNVAGTDGSSNLWLDHLSSIAPGKPILNGEWHFIGRKKPDDRARLSYQMYRAVLRRLQLGTIWLGSREDWGSKYNGIQESFPRYPEALETIGRTSLKLRMLYPLIKEFGSLDGGSIRIYYDKYANSISGKKYFESIENAYEKVKVNASGVRFVYPDSIDEKHLENVDLLLIGNTDFLGRKAASVIEKWVNNGGVLWRFGKTKTALTDYWKQPLPISKSFQELLTGGGKFGKGMVVTDENWKDYRIFLSGPYAVKNNSIINQIECRLIKNPDDGLKYLSIENNSDNDITFSLKDPSRILPEYCVDLWSKKRDSKVKLSAEITLGRYGIMLLKEIKNK